MARIASATVCPCDTSTSTCRSLATASSGRCFLLAISVLLRFESIPQGGPLKRGRIRVRLDEAEAAVVRDLFAWFADEGATILAMRQRLARLGIASPRGHRTWNASALHGVLTNPTDLGQIFANRARTRPADRKSVV